MLLSNPLSLWSLVAVVAIALMHWRRDRVPMRRVAGLHLWTDADRGTAVPERSQPRALVTMLNIIAALLLVVIACGLFSGDESGGAILPGPLWLTRCLILSAAAVALSISWKASR